MTKFVSTSVAAVAMFIAPIAAGAAAMMMSMHGIPAGGDGPAYTNRPSLTTTAALVMAGGGAADYSTAKALTALVGPKLVQAEIAKLNKQYGKAKVASWIMVSDFAVRHSAATASAAGVKFPTPPLSLKGHTLAVALVKYGVVGNTFYTGTMLDHLVSHKIHVATMDAIDAKYGTAADANYHRISNQAFVDVAHALGATTIKVASFH